MNSRRFSSFANMFLGSLVVWLASEQIASAQPLLAQTGTAKTAIGWGIVALCIGLGLLVVCRTSVRTPATKPKVKAKK